MSGELSRTLDAIHGELMSARPAPTASSIRHLLAGGNRTVKIDRSDCEQMLKQLRLAERLARSMEQELAVHRLHETEKAERALFDDLAADVAVDVLNEASGTVIRPDFGRKS